MDIRTVMSNLSGKLNEIRTSMLGTDMVQVLPKGHGK